MFSDLSIFQMSSMMASHAGKRQALAAQNMANVDTPGYQGKRLSSFAEIVGDLEYGPALRATRSRHLSDATDGLSLARSIDVKDRPSPDGNTVSVETELLESIAAEREHKRALAIYKSALNVLHTAVSGR